MKKYELFKEHRDKKALPLFFPSLYEEYFALWPPTPDTTQDAAVDTATAVAKIRGAEELVRGFGFLEHSTF